MSAFARVNKRRCLFVLIFKPSLAKNHYLKSYMH